MIKNPTYRFYTAGNMVIAVSSFAGSTVRGVAKCNPNDEFDLEYGKKLASARCAFKIASKRRKRANNKLAQAYSELEKVSAHAVKMGTYVNDAEARYIEAISELEDVTNLKKG